MARGKNIRSARDAARHLQHMRRIEGRPLLDARGDLWLMSPTEDSSSLDLFAICAALREPLAPSIGQLRQLFDATDLLEIDAGRLGKWAHSAIILQAALPDMQRWIAEGNPALRKWRGEDLEEHLRTWRDALERISCLREQCAAVFSREGEVEDGEELLSILDLSLSSLLLPGDRDPARELCSHAWQIEHILTARLHDYHPSDSRARVASALLGARGIVGVEHIPTALSSAWRAGHTVPTDLLGALLAIGPTPTNAAMLQTLPLDALPWAPRLLVRVTALFGQPAGQWVLDEGLRLARKSADIEANESELTDRFLESLELLELLEREDVVDAWLPEAVEMLRDSNSRDDQMLARCFRQFLQDNLQEADLVSSRTLARAASTAADRGIVARGEAMANAWLSRARSVDQEQDHPENHKARCVAALHIHKAKLRIEDHYTGSKLRALLQATRGHEPSQLAITWREFGKHNTNTFSGFFFKPDSKTITWKQGELDALLEHSHAWIVGELFAASGEKAVHRYAETIMALASANLTEAVPVEERWFANLFAAGKPWLPDYLLTVATVFSQEASGEALAMQLLALTRQASGNGSRFEKHLSRWHTPTLEQEHERLDEISACTNLPIETLTAYLHHRRIARGCESFSKQISALLDPNNGREKTASQIAWLEGELAREELEPERAPKLEARLETLRSRDFGEENRGRWRRARNQIERALKLLETESLERSLDLYWSELLTAKLGRPIPPERIDGRIREVSVLLTNDEDIQGLFFRFLESVIDGDALWSWPANKAWLERMSAAGMDTSSWLEGFSREVDIGGKKLHVSIEKDPIEALKMGSYFQTCLSLDGCHGEAALLDTVDVNKQVVYVRDENGALVGRKLIGVSQTGGLLGYQTYARSNHDAALMQQAIDPLVRQFASDCGLKLADKGSAPAALHGSEHWYDDGTHRWVEALVPEQLEAETGEWWGIDSHAALEHAFLTARREDDIAKLEQIAQFGNDTMRALALREIIKRAPDRQHQIASIDCNIWDLPSLVGAYVLCGEGLDARQRVELTHMFYSESNLWDPLSYLLWAATTDEALQDAIIDKLANIRAKHFEGGTSKQVPYLEVRDLTALLGAPLPRLLTFFDDLFTIHQYGKEQKWSDMYPATIDSACDLLAVSWALAPDEALLCGYVDAKTPPVLGQVLLRFLTKIKIEGASDRLLRRSSRPDDKTILDWLEAIGRQADPRARAELERLLEVYPQHEKEIARALARCGDPSRLDAIERRRLRALRRAAVRTLDAYVSQGLHQETPDELIAALDKIARIGSAESANVLADLCELCEAHARGFEPHHTHNLDFVHGISKQKREVLERFDVKPRPELTTSEVEHLDTYHSELESLRLLYLCSNLLRAPERDTRLAAYKEFGAGTNPEGRILARIGAEFHDVCGQDVIEKHIQASLFGHMGFNYNIPLNIQLCIEWAKRLDSLDQLREALGGKVFRHHDILSLDVGLLLEFATSKDASTREAAREMFWSFMLESDDLATFNAFGLAWLFIEPDDEDGQGWLMEMLEEKLDRLYIDTEEIAQAFCEAPTRGGEIFSTRLALATLAHLEEHNPTNYQHLIEYLDERTCQRSLGLARASRSQMRINPSM